MVENITPDIIRKQPLALRYYIYIVALSVIVALFYIFAATLPYEPFKFYGWDGVPTTKCTNEPIDVRKITSVKSGPYTIEGITSGKGYWIDEQGVPYGNYPIQPKGVPLEPHERELTPSVVNRVTPPFPGKWRVGFTGVVEGKMFGIVPTQQELILESNAIVTVIDDNDPRCNDGSMGD